MTAFSLTAIASSSDLIAGALIAVAFFMLIAAAEIWHRVGKPKVETTRKLVHLGGGLVCLALPFVIESHWVVLTLALSMAAIFIISKAKGWLPSIHAIQRRSHGTAYYPFVIYFLFLLASATPWKYVIAVLTLAVSDSVAAIIGTKFGKMRFQVEDEYKSVEGSLAFFAATFVVVAVPLFCWSPLGDRAEATVHYLLASLLIGLLVMCFEIVSLRGTDNLWIPLGTFFVLTKTMQTDVYDLVSQNISFLSILLIVIVIAFISQSLNIGASLVFCLSSYGCWAMGSFDWAIPFFIGYTVYIISYFVSQPWRLRVKPVAYGVLPPILLLVVANIALNEDRFDIYQFMFGPFLAAGCVGLTQASVNLLRQRQQNAWLNVAGVVLISFLISICLALPVIYRQELPWVAAIMTIFLVCLACSLLSFMLVTTADPGNAPRGWLLSRSLFSLSAGAIVICLQIAEISPIWKPL